MQDQQSSAGPAQAIPTRSNSRELMFVCSDLLVGGTECQLVEVASTLFRLGWKVSVYSTAGTGPLQAALERAGVTVILPPLNRLPTDTWIKRILALIIAVPHLLLAMMRRQPAIVHFMLPEAYLVGAPLAKVARVPVKIMSRRSLNLYQKNWPVRKLERRLHHSMGAVLGNSLSVVRQLKEEEDVPTDRLGLIYNGINLDSFANSGARNAVRKSLGIRPNVLVMCMIANLIAYKGHNDLINALAIAAKQMPAEWHLLLVGHGDGIGARLKNKAEQLGLAKNISFLGLRTDIPALLAASDVGILCSHQEGFANAILEGMAARLPMIVTDVGGNSEAVINGVTGIVVPPKDPERLAEAIVQLARNQSMRSAYGAAGWQRVTERFGMQRCVALHDLLYRELLAGRMPGDIPELKAL